MGWLPRRLGSLAGSFGRCWGPFEHYPKRHLFRGDPTDPRLSHAAPFQHRDPLRQRRRGGTSHRALSWVCAGAVTPDVLRHNPLLEGLLKCDGEAVAGNAHCQEIECHRDFIPTNIPYLQSGRAWVLLGGDGGTAPCPPPDPRSDDRASSNEPEDYKYESLIDDVYEAMARFACTHAHSCNWVDFLHVALARARRRLPTSPGRRRDTRTTSFIRPQRHP